MPRANLVEETCINQTLHEVVKAVGLCEEMLIHKRMRFGGVFVGVLPGRAPGNC